MKQTQPPPMRNRDELRHALAALVREAAPQISKFAAWALEHPDNIAFYSIRDLAERADTNVNTVYRFSIALGYPGFEACKRNFQTALLRATESYGTRAARLVGDNQTDLVENIRSSTIANVESMLSPENAQAIHAAATLMAQARTVYCIGARSSFSLAHYLAYTGRMAFANFARPLIELGSILDVMSEATEEDVVVMITFSLYSTEVLGAHRVARARGAQIVTITDSYTSPIAEGAKLVFTLPMQGPQTLPSLSAGFALVEAVVNDMIASDKMAPQRITKFERRLLDDGTYVGG